MKAFILLLLSFPALACPTLEGQFKRCTVFGDSENFPKISDVTIRQEVLEGYATYHLTYAFDGVPKPTEMYAAHGKVFEHEGRLSITQCRGESLYVTHLIREGEDLYRVAVFEYARIGTQELRFMADIADLGYVAVSCR